MRIFIFILLFTFSNQLFGQEVMKGYVTIQTIDKKIISGKLIKLNQDSIVIRNRAKGILSFLRSDIRQMVNGEVLNIDKVNLSEPFYFPTALSNGEGNHHYKNYFLFGHNFNFGMTDRLDLSVGFELASIIFGSNASPIFQLGAKYRISTSENFSVALASKVAFNTEGGLILLQLPFTLGGRSHNFTLSPTIGLDSDIGEPEFFLGGNWSFAITDKTRLIADFILDNDFRTANVALEFTIKSQFSILPGVVWSNEFSLIPSVAFTIPFGKWK